MPTASATSASGSAERLRIDRWLWCARFYKTRSIAAEAVRGGHVRVNGERVKAAREVKIGDALTVQRGDAEVEVVVTGIPQRRGPAPEAARCYEETAASIERREQAAAARAALRIEPPTRGKPDKRTRRLLRSHLRRDP